jgi:hypothetical protein
VARSPESALVPAIGRKKIAPTVVLPDRRGAPPDRRSEPPDRRVPPPQPAPEHHLEQELFGGIPRSVLVGIAISLAVVAFVITAALSGRRPAHRASTAAAVSSPVQGTRTPVVVP